jgi:hypothetical protein
MFASVSRSQLFRGEAERFAAFVDQLAHLADALGALGLTLVGAEDVGRTARPGGDRRANLTFPNPVAVTDVQGAKVLSE